MSNELDTIKQTVLSERAKGNLVFRALPDTICIIPINEFVEQPADGILYDLNRTEEISLTFLSDPKWINDFAAALTIRKLVQQRNEYRKELAAAKAEAERSRRDAERYRWLRNSSMGQYTHPIVVEQLRSGDHLKYIAPLMFDALDAAIDAARKEQP